MLVSGYKTTSLSNAYLRDKKPVRPISLFVKYLLADILDATATNQNIIAKLLFSHGRRHVDGE